jgi:hypothetical protein
MEKLYEELVEKGFDVAGQNKAIVDVEGDDSKRVLGEILADLFPIDTPTGDGAKSLNPKQIGDLAYRLRKEINASTAFTDDPKVDQTIHILSVFMEIEDTSRTKYNYTMSENDRAFALYLLEKVIDGLRKKTDGSTGEVTESAGLAENKQLLKILEGYKDEGGNDDQQLRKRIKFEAMMDGILIEGKTQIDAAGSVDDKEKIIQSIVNHLMQIQKTKGLPYWANKRIDTAIDEVRQYVSGSWSLGAVGGYFGRV